MERTTIFYAAVLLTGVFLSAISQVMLKKAALRTYSSKLREYLNPFVIVAYMIFVGTTLLSVYAYKGIPLAAAAAVALADKYQKDVNFCFDRKEVKDHGEGGMFVGKKLTDGEKVVIIEDVMTSGKAMAEVYPKLKSAADVDITGMVITVDRMERALEGEKSAVQAVYEKYGVPVYSIVNMEDIIQGIRDEVIPGKEHLDAMLAYREQYGVKA